VHRAVSAFQYVVTSCFGKIFSTRSKEVIDDCMMFLPRDARRVVLPRHCYRKSSVRLSVSVVNKDLTLKAKAKAKDLSLDLKDKFRDCSLLFAATMASPGFDGRGHKN